MTINYKDTSSSVFTLVEKRIVNWVGIDHFCHNRSIFINSIMLALTPFTAVADVAKGICETFYATYQGAPAHRITMIAYKKIIASPLQHVIYVIACVFYRSFSKAISSELFPKWLCPEEFNIFSKPFYKKIDKWVEEGSPNERDERNRIKLDLLRFYYNDKTDLYLSSKGVSSLPDIFDLQPFTSKLKALYLSGEGSCSDHLSESYCRLLGIRYINSLPEPLNSTVFIRLPESLGSLQALTTLDLITNSFTILLPESLGNLQALTTLNLSCNRNLTTLPESLGNLQALTTLNLSFNRNLFGIPMQLLDLPSSTVIDLTGCSFSQTVLETLREVITSPNYQGPQISFSIADRNERVELSIKESLAALYRVIGKEPEDFSDLGESGALRSWLSRLSDIADYKSGGELQKGLVHKIIAYISQANTDKEFRKVFNRIIQGASATCGDRMALSILHLGINYQLAIIDLKDTKGLASFLKGVWAIDLLEKIARKKVATLPFFDEIEVYLGYPIKLKEDLSLPIDIQEMLYFRCSALQEKDLKEAKDSVLSTQKDQDAYYEFLINHDKWKKCLSINRKKEYQALKDKRDKEHQDLEDKRDKDSAADHDDYVGKYEAIKNAFDQELIKLTKQELDICTIPEIGLD